MRTLATVSTPPPEQLEKSGLNNGYNKSYSSQPLRPSAMSSFAFANERFGRLKSSRMSPPSSATNCIRRWVELTLTRVYPQCLSVL